MHSSYYLTLLPFFQDLAKQLQSSAHKALTAVDWPPSAMAASASSQRLQRRSARQLDVPSEQQGLQTDRQSEVQTAEARVSDSTDGSGLGGGVFLRRVFHWLRQAALMRYAVQDWTERLWRVNTCSFLNIL